MSPLVSQKQSKKPPGIASTEGLPVCWGSVVGWFQFYKRYPLFTIAASAARSFYTSFSSPWFRAAGKFGTIKLFREKHERRAQGGTQREDFRMKENKITRRNFLKVGAAASAVGLLSAAPVAASAAQPDAVGAAEEENGLLDF